MRTDEFDFHLPEDRIATRPVSPRDASRLLVVNGEGGSAGLKDDFTKRLCDYLRPGDVMVFNNTRVIPARLHGTRGEVAIELTLHRSESGSTWTAFARPGKRLKVGDEVIFAAGFSCIVKEKREEGEIQIKFNSNNIMADLHLYGEMPLPHYMKRDAQKADLHSYQTVYAAQDGAVAAPTAGLHFTPQLLDSIAQKGVSVAYVTLHVGAGTFKPVKADLIAKHKMHHEYYEITDDNAKIINSSVRQGGRVIAVGTTSLRVLESVADETGNVMAASGETGIFITPGYRFKCVDILMTNFHLPRSTLFMLVSAFSGIAEMKQAYAHAISEGYRFYSYGDACLLFPQEIARKASPVP